MQEERVPTYRKRVKLLLIPIQKKGGGHRGGGLFGVFVSAPSAPSLLGGGFGGPPAESYHPVPKPKLVFGTGMPGGMGAMPDRLTTLLCNDVEIQSKLNLPKVQNALKELFSDPPSAAKHVSDPDIAPVLVKVLRLLTRIGGGSAGMPGMGGVCFALCSNYYERAGMKGIFYEPQEGEASIDSYSKSYFLFFSKKNILQNLNAIRKMEFKEDILSEWVKDTTDNLSTYLSQMDSLLLYPTKISLKSAIQVCLANSRVPLEAIPTTILVSEEMHMDCVSYTSTH
eukprot:GHVR01025990.1.p1 GENE.GHVR01025990.1~~GHVR01025990.1.p1  ORF type:complete len:283 (-),score=43.79 GHVR01025990.1:623-1471(-)